jgi:tetratricopeptide (TPR) repeat protein
LTLCLLVVGSLTSRIVYFTELNASPLIELHRWDQSDMHYYDGWGRQIARGDWLSRAITPPMHAWQRAVAESYFARNPDVRAALSASPQQSSLQQDADTALWLSWTGGHRFYEDPLYPYLIGLTYRFVGDDVRFVFVWQMALGVLSAVLIWWLTLRYFGDTVAGVAGCLILLCAPLMYYELILLRETSILFAGLALTWIVDRALTQRSWRWFAGLGASLALACLLKSSFALLVLGFATGVTLHFRGRWSLLRAPAAVGATTFAITMLPLALRNASLGVPALDLASSGGLTFIVSNDVNYPPERGFHVDIPRVADLMGQSNGRLIPAVVATLRSHSLPTYIGLLWRKFDRIWHWFEIPNDDNFYYTRRYAPILSILPITFWLCAPLALAGIAMSGRQLWRMWPLAMLTAFSFVPLIVFYVQGRFRVQLMAAAIPFASLTLVECVRWGRQHQYLRLAWTAAVVIGLAFWTGRPLEGRGLIRMADWLAPFNVRYDPEVRAAQTTRDSARAASAYLAFFQYEPSASQLASPYDQDTIIALGQMHLECASYLREAGQLEQARNEDERMRALMRFLLSRDPANVEARGQLADASFGEGSFEQAAAEYRAYLQSRPDDLWSLTHFGIALIESGKLEEAIESFRHAVTVDPTNADVQRNLANALFDSGDVGEARQHAERVVALRPSDAAAHDLLGRTLAAEGKLDAALAEFQRSLDIDPTYADARQDLQRLRR